MDAVKKKPEEWAEETGIRILDPDGWRSPGDPSYDEPITLADFSERTWVSTVQVVDPALAKAVIP